jgi:hypothetical protein
VGEGVQVKTNNPQIKAICKAAFPNYKGRKFYVQVGIPVSLDSWWDGGSRDYYAFVDIVTNQSAQVHSNHPAFEPNQPSTLKDPESLPPNVAVVSHRISCGKDVGCTLYLRPSQMACFTVETVKQLN